MPFPNRNQEIKQLLRDGAQAERKKILATTGGNCEIRRAFERQVQEQAWKRPPGQTLSWWTPEIESAHRDWLSDPGPAPVLYEDLTPTEPWQAGQPVLITLDGQQTLSWLRLSSLNFSPRWLRGDMAACDARCARCRATASRAAAPRANSQRQGQRRRRVAW